ncbi:hypothetical protein Ahy_A02g008262 [Arachis hypogaea]|uniref:Gamma-soluble NSF attachment protein n=1 Tax=Arachis hypogaea TaxID=3818 RepID=A0A445EE27_ARAHY|nr:hypothetical protein Ahy_A02g008262 [Arachis hypogaea]
MTSCFLRISKETRHLALLGFLPPSTKSLVLYSSPSVVPISDHRAPSLVLCFSPCAVATALLLPMSRVRWWVISPCLLEVEATFLLLSGLTLALCFSSVVQFSALEETMPEEAIQLYTDVITILEEDGGGQMAFDLYRSATAVYIKLEKIDAFCKSDQNRCASNLLAAYSDGDIEEIKRIAQSSSISNLDHSMIRLARKLPTGDSCAAAAASAAAVAGCGGENMPVRCAAEEEEERNARIEIV